MKNLLLAKVDRRFDPDRDVAVGPWCFVGVENLYPEWEDLPFLDPFASPNTVETADTLCRRLASAFVSIWAQELNTKLDRNYPVQFWHSLLISWLVFSCQVTWRRFETIRMLVEHLYAEQVRVSILDQLPAHRFPRTTAFTEHMNACGAMDLWMSSQIVKALAPGHWDLVPLQSEEELAYNDDIPKDYKGTGQILRRLIGRLRCDSVVGLKAGKILFSFLAQVLPPKPAAEPLWIDAGNVLEEVPPAYLSFLENFLRVTLPESFDCEFYQLDGEARQQRYVPGKLFIDHLGTLDDRRRYVVAHAHMAGERLLGCQHGAWYGTARTASWAAEAEYPYEGYVTWGWRSQQDLAVRPVPLPSPLLSRLKDKHRVKNNKLILAGAHMFFAGGRFDCVPSPVQAIEYRKLKRRFIDGLDQAPRDHFWYRPHAKKKITMDDELYIRHHYTEVPIVSGDFDAEMLSCKLLVLDNPGTLFNLAMAAKTPLVCFWDPDHWAMCRQAEPSFQRLRDVGMLFDKPEDAAGHINEIWTSPMVWWKSAVVQNAREAFCREFAWGDRIWWWHWIKALQNI